MNDAKTEVSRERAGLRRRLSPLWVALVLIEAIALIVAVTLKLRH